MAFYVDRRGRGTYWVCDGERRISTHSTERMAREAIRQLQEKDMTKSSNDSKFDDKGRCIPCAGTGYSDELVPEPEDTVSRCPRGHVCRACVDAETRRQQTAIQAPFLKCGNCLGYGKQTTATDRSAIASAAAQGGAR